MKRIWNKSTKSMCEDEGFRSFRGSIEEVLREVLFKRSNRVKLKEYRSIE